MNITEALKTASSSLTSQHPQQDAEVLLANVLKKDKAFLFSHGELKLNQKQKEAFFELVERRKELEPIAYLTGLREFYGRSFQVNPHVLIPRPETEELIDIAKELLDEKTSSKIIDLGTGSGCIGITLALEIKGASVQGVDISKEALTVARTNAKNLKAKIRFKQSNLLTGIKKIRQTDLIVANLPYLTTADIAASPTAEELRFEPSTALLAEDEGLALIRLAVQQSLDILKPGGQILLELLPEQTPILLDWIKQERLPFTSEKKKDLSGKERFLVLTLP